MATNGNGSIAGNASGTKRDKNIAGKAGQENESGKSGDASTDAGTDASAGPDAGPGTQTGPGTEKVGTETGSRNNATVNPTSLAPDEYERDEAGNIIFKADGVTPRKKRGRKPGQTAAASSAKPTARTKTVKQGDRSAMAVEMLAAQFQILNTGIAFMTRFDDFKLEDSEAMQMATATANVMEQFDYVPDPKIAAVMGLVTTTGMIYGPRVYLYQRELVKRREEKRASRVKEADERAVAETSGNIMPLNTGQFYSG